MLPQKKRLNKKEFDRFFASGKRYHSPSFMLVHEKASTFQASAVAPKKVFKTAVLRNKFRRRVYAIFERLLREGGCPTSGVYICVGKAHGATLPFSSLQSELSLLISKIR